MKKILSEGLLVGFFLLLGVSYAQNLRTAQKTPIIPSQKVLLNFLERNATRKNNHPSLPKSLSKSSNANSTFVADTVVVKNTLGNSRYSFTYDASGKVASKLTENLQNGYYEFRFRDSYKYDSSSKTKTKLEEKWFKGNWINDSRTISVYDDAGNEISYLTQHDLYGLWENSLRISRTFTTHGDWASELGERWKDGKWENWWKEKWVFDGKSHLTFYSSEDWKSDNWECVDQMSWIIDVIDNRTTIYIGKKFVTGEWINSTYDEITLNSEGEIKTHLGGDWIDNNNRVLTYVRHLTYSVDGKTAYLEEWFGKDSKCDSVSRYTYVFTSNKKLLSVLKEKGKNYSKWVNSYRMIYDYDANGNVVKFQSASWINSSWQPDDFVFHAVENKIESFYGYDISLHYKPLDKFVGVESEKLPSGFELYQNYPNPFNPETTISYKVQAASQVSLKVYDVLGREVATLVNEFQQAGFYNSQFSIRNLPAGRQGYQLTSGVYFYRLQAGSYTSTKKMILLQ